MRARLLVAAALAAVPPATLAARAADFPGLPSEVSRVLERDWCSPSSYDAARRAARRAGHRLSRDARRNLYEGERTAGRHPKGCRLAERAAHGSKERIRLHAPWLDRGCPKGPLATGRNWRRDAALAAAGALARSERPVLLGDAPSLRGTRSGQVVQACGRATAGRSVTVSLALTGYYPSASLSERVVAVARFRHYGWRVWLLLH